MTLKCIDYKFCRVHYDDRDCGCGYNWCTNMSEQEGFSKIPSKNTYNCHFNCSCTPEWHMQVQIGTCNTYNGYCARFIFEIL